MNHSLDKVITPKGEVRYELRVWGRHGGSDLKRRFKDRDTALKELKKLYSLAKLASDPDDPPFVQEFEYWFKTRQAHFAPGWQKNIPTYWNALKPFLENKKCSEVNKALLSDIQTDLLSKGNSQKTVNLKLGFIVAVLNHSLKMDRISSHKLLGWRKTRAEKKLPQFWSKHDAEAFLRFANATKYPPGSQDRWVFAVYLLALSTGMRAGEIWALRWKNFRPEVGLIEVISQHDTAKKIFRTTKGRAARSVPLDADLWSEISKLSDIKTKESLIFHHEFKPICHRAFTRRFDRDCKKSPCPKINFHALRHTAATLMLASGVDIKTIQEVLGHESVTTTMGYVHALKEGVRSVPKLFKLTV